MRGGACKKVEGLAGFEVVLETGNNQQMVPGRQLDPSHTTSWKESGLSMRPFVFSVRSHGLWIQLEENMVDRTRPFWALSIHLPWLLTIRAAAGTHFSMGRDGRGRRAIARAVDKAMCIRLMTPWLLNCCPAELGA